MGRLQVKRDVMSLPIWAQQEIIEIESQRDMAIAKAKLQYLANTVLESGDWFTVQLPAVEGVKDGDVISLFTLSLNCANAVCSLRQGDLLLVGRRNRKDLL